MSLTVPLLNYYTKFNGYTIPPNCPENKKLAIIIEPRKLDHLVLVIKNVMYYLQGWNLLVLGSTENKDQIKDFPHLVLNVTQLTLMEYSQFLKSKSFWENLPFEDLLIFQSDCLLLRGIPSDVFPYDMVGAPCGLQYKTLNGGLSFRKKSRMLEVLEKIPVIADEPEDVYFTRGLRELKRNLPSEITAAKYFVESYVLDDYLAVGIHGIGKKYMDAEVIHRLIGKVTDFPMEKVVPVVPSIPAEKVSPKTLFMVDIPHDEILQITSQLEYIQLVIVGNGDNIDKRWRYIESMEEADDEFQLIFVGPSDKLLLRIAYCIELLAPQGRLMVKGPDDLMECLAKFLPVKMYKKAACYILQKV